MAVFTPLNEAEAREFLARYDIGELKSLTGIAEGIENSNFLITVMPHSLRHLPESRETPQQVRGDKFILTLFEKRVKAEELPYFMAYMEWLAERDIACPQPVQDREGRILHALKERPAAIVTFLEGSGVGSIKQEHMAPLGELAARMHLAGEDFPYTRKNGLSVAGWEAIIDKIIDRADEIQPGLRALINEEFNFLSENWPDDLPSGPVHADLFPDNVFFQRGKLTGVIDFYFACNEAWAYDLAIIINAWCFDSRQRFVPERVQALLQAYTNQRSFTPEEEAAFPLLLRGAALRFLLTRAHDRLFHPSGAQVTPKDPLEYVAKLEHFREQR